MTTFTTKNADLRVNEPDGRIMARLEKGFATLAISPFPFIGNWSIVFGGQLECKLCVAIGPFRMGDEFHLGTLKKNVHSFNRYINHPLWSFSSTQKYPPLKCRI